MTDSEEPADEPETPESSDEETSGKVPKKKAARKASKAPGAKKTPAKKAPEPAEDEGPKALEVEAEPFDSSTPPVKGERTVEAKDPRKESGTPAGGERAWCMACHLSTLVAFGIPVLLVGFVGPILIGQLLKGRHPEVAHHSREAINFQLNFLLWNVLAYVMSFSCVFSCLGPPLAVALPLVNIALTIVAGLKASEGEKYRYPYTIRILGSDPRA